MSKLKIYGVTMSRAYRTLWLARELGLDFEQVPVSFADGGTRAPEYLAINPNGRIPAIDDGGFVMWESLAINLYLARKHGGGLWPDGIENEGRAFQWSFWVVTEVETPLLALLSHRALLPEAGRDEGVARRNEEKLAAPFTVLDKALGDVDYLAGDRFTVADLNVASVMAWTRHSRMDLAAWPALAGWLDRCLSRPAAAR